MPCERTDSLDELFAERRRNPEFALNLSSHVRLGIRPTTFAELPAAMRRYFVG